MEQTNIYTIENKHLSVGITTNGGTLTSIFDKQAQQELLWQGDKKSWQHRDILIFPLIARLRDDCYECGQKTYQMQSHGLLRYSTLSVVDHDQTTLHLQMLSSEDTLKHYPFPFAFSVIYHLSGRRLDISFSVRNTGESDMPFMLGTHPAFALDADEADGHVNTSGNFIEFDKEESPYYYQYAGDLPVAPMPYGEFKRIELDKSLFGRHPTLILEGLRSKRVTLLRRNGTKIELDLGYPQVLALWSHKTQGAFVCVESWFGLADTADNPKEISQKSKINMLKSSQEFEYEYSIKI